MNQFDVKKNIIYGIAALIILGAIGGMIYYFLLRTAPTAPQTGFGTLPNIPSGGGAGGGMGATQQGATGEIISATTTLTGTLDIGTTTPNALQQIIAKPILNPTLSQKGDVILYFVRAGGKAESADLNGENITQISNLTILNMLNAAWQPVSKQKNIISYLDKETKKTFVMTVATATQTAFLPETTVDASWSPDGNSIAYLTRQNNTASLFISGSSGKSGKFMFSPTIPDFSIQWAAKNKILFVTKPSGLAPGMAYLFDTNAKSFFKIIDRAFGLTASASSDGKLLLSAGANDAGGKPNAFLGNIDGSGMRQLPFATMPEKCAFGPKNTNLFCAAPQNMSAFEILPDDWYMSKGFFSDNIIVINTKTFAVTELTPPLPVDAINLFLSPQEDFLFFQNKKDYSLWRLKLK
ncbi:hypothetical protein KGQ34_02395 [Patescibacteria group bacterium]|nr:hypothetical protein [Patescibacteria group bacterium]